jgi:hypothetical protein
MPREVSQLPSLTTTKLQDACDNHNIKLRDPTLLTPPRITLMFLFCSIPESRGVSRPSRTLGWNAVDVPGRRTNGLKRGRRNRVVLIPRRWDQVRGKPAGDGGYQARHSGESAP